MPPEDANAQIDENSARRIGEALPTRSPPESEILERRTHHDSKDDLYNYCLALENKTKLQEAELTRACKEAEDARTHATILGRQYTVIMNLRNAKKTSCASGTFDMHARVMNTDEAILILRKEEADRVAEEVRLEALETGHQRRLVLQTLNVLRLPWFEAAADVVIQRQKAVVAAEKEAVKATAKALRDAKAAEVKEANAARRLEEKQARDAAKAKKLAIEKEAKALEKAAKVLEKAEISARRKKEKADEVAHQKQLRKADALRLKQAKASEALREREAKGVAAVTVMERGKGKRASLEPAGGVWKRQKASNAVTKGDKENTDRAVDNSPGTRTLPVSPVRCHPCPKPKPRYVPLALREDEGSLSHSLPVIVTSSVPDSGPPQQVADNQTLAADTDMVRDDA